MTRKNGNKKGKYRCFGEYTCPECSRHWMSSNSGAGCEQKCNKCDIMVLPHKLEEKNSSTPYKGKRRCFGEYRCPECNRRWMSSNSWADYGQRCQNCDIMVLPHKQKPLRKPDGLDVINKKKKHPEDLCQKCNELGFYCRESTFAKIKV